MNIGKVAVCYTDDFVIEHGGLVNATIGDSQPGMFWHAWVKFHPHTDINRVGQAKG